MLPALIFLVLNGILPFIASKHLGPAGCFTALLISIPVSLGILLLISNASMNHLIYKKFLHTLYNNYNRSIESADAIEAKKQEIVNENNDRYIKINFFYVFLCFTACTIFAFTIYDGSLTIMEFAKACIRPFAIFDGFHFIREIIYRKNVFDALLGVLITGSIAMAIGGSVLLFMAVVYVLVKICVAIAMVIMALFVYIFIKLFRS